MSKVVERTFKLKQLVSQLNENMNEDVYNMGLELYLSYVKSKLEQFQEILMGYSDDLLNDLENEFKAGFKAGRLSALEKSKKD